MTDERIREAREELETAAEELGEIIERVDQTLRAIGGLTEKRARAYWFAQIRMAIDDDHDYLGSATCSMRRTIEELTPPDDEDEPEGA